MPHRSAQAAKAAREVARAASHLASEAASLARIYADQGPAEDAALQAGEASVHAAHQVFALDRLVLAAGEDAADAAIRASLASLEAASAAVAATRAALDAALLVSHRGRGVPDES